MALISPRKQRNGFDLAKETAFISRGRGGGAGGPDLGPRRRPCWCAPTSGGTWPGRSPWCACSGCRPPSRLPAREVRRRMEVGWMMGKGWRREERREREEGRGKRRESKEAKED
eukprot:3793017-Rhodomonas_salina.3